MKLLIFSFILLLNISSLKCFSQEPHFDKKNKLRNQKDIQHQLDTRIPAVLRKAESIERRYKTDRFSERADMQEYFFDWQMTIENLRQLSGKNPSQANGFNQVKYMGLTNASLANNYLQSSMNEIDRIEAIECCHKILSTIYCKKLNEDIQKRIKVCNKSHK